MPSSAERADGERVARGSLLCRAMISLRMRATSVGDSNAQHQCQSEWKFPASKYGEKGIYPQTSTVQIHTPHVNYMRHARQHLSITSTIATFEESSVPIYWIQMVVYACALAHADSWEIPYFQQPSSNSFDLDHQIQTTGRNKKPGLYCSWGHHPVNIGDNLHGRYNIVHILGFGSYSTVWLARY